MSADLLSSHTPARISGTSSYIARELRHHDRDRFLTTLFAPPECREDLWALYAFNAEVARILESVSEPMLGRIKVQWWRDVIGAIADGRGAPSGHPIAQALASTMTVRGLTRQWIDDLLSARDAEFGDEGFADLAEMEEHADGTAVRLAWLALEILQISDPASRDAVRHAALSYALIGMLRAVPFHASRNRLLLPRDLMESAGVTLVGLQSGRDRAALGRVAKEIVMRGRHHLVLAKGSDSAADRRSMPVLLWGTLTDRAISALVKSDYDVFHRRMAAYRPSLLQLLWRSWRGGL